jgi:hypothetical protein
MIAPVCGSPGPAASSKKAAFHVFNEGSMFIATGGPKERKPIQVRAEILRNGELPAPYCAWQGFAPMTEDAADEPNEGVDHTELRWRDADLERAIDAAEKSGVRPYRVEIAPDGTISIFVGDPPQVSEHRPIRN